MGCSTPGFPVLHYLPEFSQTHVHWVGEVIHSSHPLLPPSPPALHLSQHQGLFQSLGSSHQMARVEAKNPALLSNRDGYLLELTGWTQGSQAS